MLYSTFTKEIIKSINMKTKTLWIAVGIICTAAALWLIFRPTGKQTVTLETAKTERIDISNSVTATGTVEPVTKVEVGTQVSGIIDKLYADYNDIVKAGQVIAEMDKVNLQAELVSSQAQLSAAKTEFEYREKEYNRTKTLHDKELVSDSEYDSSYYQYETAKNAYNQAQASFTKVKRNLSYATITSPIDGVVISRAVEEGQTVAAGFETPTLFTIAKDLADMQVIADVDEADIGQVKEAPERHIYRGCLSGRCFQRNCAAGQAGGHNYLERRDLRGCDHGSESGSETEAGTHGQRDHQHSGGEGRACGADQGAEVQP